MGRPAGELAIAATASGLQTHQAHGAGARRPPKRSGEAALGVLLGRQLREPIERWPLREIVHARQEAFARVTFRLAKEAQAHSYLFKFGHRKRLRVPNNFG